MVHFGLMRGHMDSQNTQHAIDELDALSELDELGKLDELYEITEKTRHPSRARLQGRSGRVTHATVQCIIG